MHSVFRNALNHFEIINYWILFCEVEMKKHILKGNICSSGDINEIKIYKKKTDYGFYIEGQCNGTGVFNCVMLVKERRG